MPAMLNAAKKAEGARQSKTATFITRIVTSERMKPTPPAIVATSARPAVCAKGFRGLKPESSNFSP